MILFRAGENKFANLGSSGTDDSVDITVQYAGGALTDTGFITDSADYVQMELTPMSQWIQTVGSPNTEQFWADSLVEPIEAIMKAVVFSVIQKIKIACRMRSDSVWNMSAFLTKIYQRKTYIPVNIPQI